MPEPYTRYLQLPPEEVEELLAGNRRLWLSLHVYANRLAIVIAPSADRYILSRKATHGRITIRKVILSIVRTAPSSAARPSPAPGKR